MELRLMVFIEFFVLVSSDNLTEYKQQFCNKGGNIRASCFSLDNDEHVLLFAYDIYFELNVPKMEIIKAQKVVEKWPDLTQSVSVDSACSTTDGITKGKRQYIFLKTYNLYIYTFKKGEMSLTTVSDIREYETFGLKNYPSGESFFCGACFNEEDSFYLTAISRTTETMHYCRYAKSGGTKKCKESDINITPYTVETHFSKNFTNCSALAYNSYKDDNVISVFVDAENISVYINDDLSERKSLNDLFECKKLLKNVIEALTEPSAIGIPVILLIIMAILLILFAIFIGIFCCYKRHFAQKGHINAMVNRKA